MTTITFNCPKCDSVCGFKELYAGRRARCLKCDQIFVIPAQDGQAAEKVEPPKENYAPLPGFYEAVFKKSLPAIFNKQGWATLLFVLLVTALKFFIVHLDSSISVKFASGGGFTVHLPFGWAIAAFVWGGLFWVYAEIISATAFDIEFLPEVIFEGGFGYLFKVITAIYSFFIILIVAALPAVVFRGIFLPENGDYKWAVLPFVLLGALLVPIAVLTVSISRDITILFRYDQYIEPIKKAFWHYLFVVGLFAAACQLQMLTKNYGDVSGKSSAVIAMHLVITMSVQIVIIFAMRTAGLFYRHFACYFKW